MIAINTLIRRCRTQIPYFEPIKKEIGNLDKVAEAGSHSNFLTQSLEHFNSDIFQYWEGLEKWVVLGNPIYCKAVARLPNKSDRESAMIGSIFGNKSILVSNHSHHARMKKYFYNIFSMRNIRDHHFKSIAKVVNDWAIPYIQQNSYEAIKGLDVGLGISFRTIISTTFGIDVINNTNECNECIEKIDQFWKLFQSLGLHGPVREGTERYEMLQSVNQKLDTLTQETIQRLSEGKQADVFAQQLVQGQEQEEIQDQVRTLIAGGTHTTGNLLNWLFYFLAKHPETQQKLQQELDIQENLFDYQTLISLKYARNLIDEALRYTYFIYSYGRVNDGPDIELPGGYIIESGSGVQVFNKKLFYHPDYWVEPNSFNPDRFLNPKSRGIHFQPFGYQGGRVCPGSNLANVETVYALASIFKRFNVELDLNQKEVKLVTSITTEPSEDILLRFTER